MISSIEVEEHEVDVTKVSDGCLKALFKNTKRLGIVIFKLVLGELLMYLLLYYAFNVLYRFVFAPEDPFSDDFDSKVKMAKANNEEEDFMTRLVSHFAHNIGAFTKILTFLLGFFVSTISKRWWDQVKLVPNPMSLAIRANGIMVPGEKALEVKKNILRYAMASWLLCLRPISKCLKVFQLILTNILTIFFCRKNIPTGTQ